MEPIITDNAIVYLQYDPENLPPRPSSTSTSNDGNVAEGTESWTRFICVSDTHCNTFDVPDGDFLLHAGDLTHSVRLPHSIPLSACLGVGR
jgi:hypothetical protein